jgi:hypothetical protein
MPFQQVIRQFLTPEVFKQGHQAWDAVIAAASPKAQQQNDQQNDQQTITHQRERSECAWSLKAILWVLLLMIWDKGDEEDERFLDARAFYVSEHNHEKRPGATCKGFKKALERVPMPVFRALAARLRREIGEHWFDALRIEGWLPMGCDGTRLLCPRTAALERALGQSGKDESAPMMYVTALALLPLGLPWAWRLDKGTGNELQHLQQMLATLPEKTLLVADAFYVGFDLYNAILQSKSALLIRMSSRVTLYSESNVPMNRFREGWVHYWPKRAQDAGQPPLRFRLLRVGGKKCDVWLLTNLDKKELPRRRAKQIYRWRWRNEGMFRTFKGTLRKTKLRHRTPRRIFREAEGAMLALQLLMAMTIRMHEQEKVVASPRRMLLRIRAGMSRGIARLGPRQRQRYEEELEAIHNENPDRAINRTSAKAIRDWTRRKRHTPPKPPKRKKPTERQKARMNQKLNESTP